MNNKTKKISVASSLVGAAAAAAGVISFQHARV
jgi:hypothetical protein